MLAIDKRPENLYFSDSMIFIILGSVISCLLLNTERL